MPCRMVKGFQNVQGDTGMNEPMLVGAVVYDPKVVVIWEIIKDFF